jgi:3-ketosteroid 9alpha-monooxygenase subunit A
MEDLSQYIKLASIHDFAQKKIQSYQVLAKFVAIVKESNGEFYATEIACKHNNADLTTGAFRGDEVRCPRHGWVYNIRTGECLNASSAPLRRHDLKIIGNDMWVSMHPLEPEIDDEDDWMPEIIIKKSDPRDDPEV